MCKIFEGKSGSISGKKVATFRACFIWHRSRQQDDRRRLEFVVALSRQLTSWTNYLQLVLRQEERQDDGSRAESYNQGNIEMFELRMIRENERNYPICVDYVANFSIYKH